MNCAAERFNNQLSSYPESAPNNLMDVRARTAIFLSRYVVSLNLSEGDFAPRHLNRWAIFGELQAVGNHYYKKYLCGIFKIIIKIFWRCNKKCFFCERDISLDGQTEKFI